MPSPWSQPPITGSNALARAYHALAPFAQARPATGLIVPHALVPLSLNRRIARVPQTLLERVGAGDADAVRECIDRFSGLIWALARRAGLTPGQAEDTVQEIFIEIWKCAARYRPEIASETAFIATIARRRLIDARRRATRRAAPQALGEETPARPISDRAEVNQEAANAAAALSTLSPEQQRVLRLSVFEGLSHERIATATGLPLGTVKTHARRGLIRIRAMLAPQSLPGDPQPRDPATADPKAVNP